MHFPAINILTCRRPLGIHIEKLVRQAHSLKLASSEPAFYTDMRRHLTGLLGSVEKLQALEVYYGEANLLHVDSTAVLADFVGILPRTLETLRVTLPGGRPSSAGIEVSWALAIRDPGDIYINKLAGCSEMVSLRHFVLVSRQRAVENPQSPI